MSKGEQRICSVESDGSLKTVEILKRGKGKSNNKVLSEWILKWGKPDSSYLVITIDTTLFGSRTVETKEVCRVSEKEEKKG